MSIFKLEDKAIFQAFLKLSIRTAILEVQTKSLLQMQASRPLNVDESLLVCKRVYESLDFLADIMPINELKQLIEKSLEPRENIEKKDD